MAHSGPHMWSVDYLTTYRIRTRTVIQLQCVNHDQFGQALLLQLLPVHT